MFPVMFVIVCSISQVTEQEAKEEKTKSDMRGEVRAGMIQNVERILNEQSLKAPPIF